MAEEQEQASACLRQAAEWLDIAEQAFADIADLQEVPYEPEQRVQDDLCLLAQVLEEHHPGWNRILWEEMQSGRNFYNGRVD